MPRSEHSLLDVEPGERRLVAALCAVSFVLGISLVLLRTAADTLFLVHFRTEDLPYVFLATLVLVPATGVLYSRLNERFGEAAIAGLSLALLPATSAAMVPLLLGAGAMPATAFLRTFVEIANALSALAFWVPVASMLNLRQAKRLYPLIGTGEVAAGILGGVAVAPLVRWLPVEDLVLISAIAGAAATAMMVSLLATRGASREHAEDEASDGQEPRRGLLRTVIHDRYLLLIALSYVFYYVSYGLLRYANTEQIEARFKVDPAAMASFFGVLSAVRTALVLGVRTFASGRMIAHYGIGFGLLSLPVVEIAGAVALIAFALVGAGSALFWAVVLLSVVEEVVRTSLNKPAVLLLYRPLTRWRRTLTQTVVETFVDPGATALVGVVILVLGVVLGNAAPATRVVAIVAVMLAALVALLVVFVFLHREYGNAVVQALSRGHLKSSRPPLNQPGAVEVAAGHLRSGNAREVLYALRVLEKLVDGDHLIAMIGDLLAHPVAEVRRDALGLVERRRLGALRDRVFERFDRESDPEVRGATARAVAALDEDEAARSLAALLEDRSESVRRSAVEALLHYGGVAGATAAGESLRRLATSADPGDRSEAADIVYAVGLPGYTGMLRALLGDTDPGVRRAALVAIGRTRNLRLLPALIAALDDRVLRVAAVRGLVAANDAALPALGALLDDPGVSEATATRAAEAIGRICGDGVWMLRKHLDHPLREVRTRVLAGLRLGAYREPEATPDAIHARIAVEVEEAAVLAAARADVASAKGCDLLHAALDRELRRSRDLVLGLVSLVTPAQPILWARRHLAGEDEEKRAYALEVVETLCPKGIRDVLLPLLESNDSAETLRRLSSARSPARSSAAERLDALAAGSHPGGTAWIAFCARHAAGRTQGDAMMLTVEKVILLKSTDFFSTIEDDILAEVATTLVEQTAAPGERIIEQGERDASLFVIVRGLLRVHDGSTVIARLGPGEVVGDLSALDPDVRTVSVTAEQETSLLRMDHATLMDLIEEHTEVAYGIIRFLVRRCRANTASMLRAGVGLLPAASTPADHQKS